MSAAIENAQPCIGLEVHVRLDTRTKLFCACPNEPLAAPNAATCPVCVGLPGAMPTLNRAAVEQALRIALRLGATIAERLSFDRKHYAYPDLPKGYQITQQSKPLGRGGALVIDAATGRSIPLRGLHLEEDAGRSRHDSANTYVDFGRSGVPLVEIVTEPALTSAEDVRLFLERLREELRFVGAATCDMENGDMRVDVNVSVHLMANDGAASDSKSPNEPTSATTTPRVELKNLNSITAAFEAVEFETERIRAELARQARGHTADLQAETRGWNAHHRRSYSIRPKEHATDYRVMPESDLVPVRVDAATLAELADALPPRPFEHRTRLRSQHGLTEDLIAAMTDSPRHLARFDTLVAAGVEADRVAKWLTNNHKRLKRELVAEGHAPVRLTDERLAALLLAWQTGTLTREGAEAVARELLAGDGRTPEAIARERGAWRDRQPHPDSNAEPIAAELDEWIAAALAAESAAVADWHAGKPQALQRLIGHVMRAARGRMDGQSVRVALEQDLPRSKPSA